ncbi:MAG: hypothetical protein AAB663_01790 [Patescibacteria group bacterium]
MQRKTKGILLVVLPIPTLFFVMVVYAIVSFFLSSVAETSDSSVGLVVSQISSILLGLIGVAAVVGILIGIPVGIYLLATEDKAAATKK